MSTARLYYDDCYTSGFKAEVLESQPVELRPNARRLYLDQTLFYPTSGGQPHDLGSIAGMEVTDVIDEGDRIAHLVDGAAGHPLSPGSLVECRLDWDRRHDHMQQHTGQHLLSAVFVELFGWKTLSFHMGEDTSSVEIATAKLDDSLIDQVERRANRLVSEARPVRISYGSADDAAGLRKPSARTGLLRIIEIEAYDRSACGGTHLRTTAEIGPVQIRKTERIRGNVRVEFVCGDRALRHSKQDFRLLSNLSKLTSVPPAALEEHIATLRGRCEAAEKALARSNGALAEAEARRLYEETAVLPDGTRRRSIVAAEFTESTRTLALAFAAQPRAVVAVVPESIPGTVLLACSPDSGLNAGALWKAAFASGGGRGGGSSTLAQGNVTHPASLAALIAAAGVPPLSDSLA